MQDQRVNGAAPPQLIVREVPDERYLRFLESFNHGHFYEAHASLEELWLSERRGPRALFYQALIQLAGAFVHLQKGRLGPATALLHSAQTKLRHYPSSSGGLDLAKINSLITAYASCLEQGTLPGELLKACPPRINLMAEPT